MAITRVTGAQMVHSFAASARNSEWEGYALQRLDTGRMVAVWKTVSGSNEYMVIGTLDANGQNPTALSTLATGPTSSSLEFPSIASTASGSFFVAWQQDPDSATPLAGNTFGRAYNSAGTAVTAQAHLSTAPTGGEYTPSVIRLGNGNVLAAWSDTLTNPAIPPQGEIMARIYSPTGAALTGEFQLNTTTTGMQFGTDAVSFGDGRGLVVWGNGGLSGLNVVSTELRGRFITATGSGQGADFNIDTIASGRNYQEESLEVVTLGDGGFAVIWEELSNTSVEEIHFQRFSSTGAKVGSETIVESSGGDNDITQMIVTELSNGGFAVAWRLFSSGSPTSHVRVYGYNGVEIGTEASLHDIANPGLGSVIDLELMRNGNVLALGPVANGIATQVFDFGDERLIGTAAADRLWGKNGVDDKIYGQAGNDALYGLEGTDYLDGGAGNDYLNGGIGNDTYIVNQGDNIFEASGQGVADIARATTTYTLAAGSNVEHLEAVNLAATTTMHLTGNEISNRVTGNAGTNQINGGLANDILTGGGGADYFLFNTALNSTTNRDRITDFNVADDTIRLENAVFTQLTATGQLNAAFFRVGAAAVDANDYIIYNSANGVLSYDSDGNAAGSAVQFAVLTPGLALTAADFFVV
jgi:Ca2+-binding RTX toxin-like protein